MKKMPLGWKRPVWGVCLLLAALLLSAAAWPTQPQATPEPEHVVLQLKWKHQFQFAGYYAALAQGYYREAGLDVEIVEASDDADPVDAVLEGDADFGVGSSDLVLLRGQGYPVVALASIFQHSPLVFLTTEDSGINNIHDLVGRRVTIEPNAAELIAYLRDESISTRNLILSPHTFDVSALLDGEVDVISAYSTDEPFELQEAGVGYLTFNPRASGIDFYGDTLFTLQGQINDHPERVSAFVDASLKGWDYALRHPDEMIELIYSQYSQRHTRDHLAFEAEKTRQLILPDVVEIGYMNPGRWQRIADTYTEIGMAPAVISLKGFLYDRTPNADMTWVYLSLSGALAVVGGVSLTAGWFYRLNGRIRREMAEKEATQAHLRSLESRYRVLVEHSPFAIVISRQEDGKILFVNPAAAQMFDITTEHALRKMAPEMYANPVHREKLLEILDRQGYANNFEVMLKTAAGAEFWAGLSATLIDFEGERAIFLAVLDETERKELQARLETLAMTDDLTGLYNRRFFMRRGRDELLRARRYKTPFSVMLLDIDRFKNVNDTYGHDGGDQVLKQFTALIRDNLREGDVLGRVGGEEFSALLLNTTSAEAARLAERVRVTVSEHRFSINDHPLRITASLGVASWREETLNLDAMLNQADAALYRAKGQGRNCVVVAEDDEPGDASQEARHDNGFHI